MNFLTIILFFIYTYGLGFSLSRWAKESDNFLERSLMRIGFGLGMVIIVGLFLNVVHLPIDWRMILALSLMLPIFYLLKNIKYKKFILKPKITRYDLIILLVLVIFFANFYMYAKGAFSYPWLEDDDSWAHAIGVKYVSVEKTAFAEKPLRYMDPYPPSYDMLFGILHQTNGSVYWTLKFFNALLVSLSIIFFFFFAKEISDKNKALFSTFALASVPAFLSHFIWAIALSIPIYFVSFYAIERIKYDKKWIFVAVIMIGAALTISPTHSAYFGLFFAAYYVIRAILEKSILLHYAAAGFFGVFVSFLLWWLPSIVRHGFRETLDGMGISAGASIVSIAGTGDRIYTLKDFVFAQKANMINNPVGIGFVLSALLVIGLALLVYKYHSEVSKNKLVIFASSSVIIVLVLFLLSQSYVKYVEKRNVAALEKGSVPFFEFLSDQLFLAVTLSIMIFMIVSLVAISYKTQDFKEKHVAIALSWMVLAFYAVNAGPFYYKLSPFRTWMLLAIPVSLVAGEAIDLINNLVKAIVKSFTKSSIIVGCASLVLIGFIAYGIFTTSFVQKYAVNTALWGPGAFWSSNEEVQGYMWFKDNIPAGTKVFTFSNNALVIGLDKFICHWCSDLQSYQRSGFNQTAEQNYDWLKKEEYKYILIDGQTVRKFGINETNNKANGFINSNKFKPVFSNDGVIIFGIV